MLGNATGNGAGPGDSLNLRIYPFGCWEVWRSWSQEEDQIPDVTVSMWEAVSKGYVLTGLQIFQYLQCLPDSTLPRSH